MYTPPQEEEKEKEERESIEEEKEWPWTLELGYSKQCDECKELELKQRKLYEKDEVRRLENASQPQDVVLPMN